GAQDRCLSPGGQGRKKNAAEFWATDTGDPRRSNYASFTRRGNMLYMHVHFWPGETVSICGLMAKVKSASLLASGKKVAFKQDRLRVQFTGMPTHAPDDPITTIAIECESEPKQDNILVRREHEREKP